MVEGQKKSLKDVFFKKPVPFSEKRDFNWSAIKYVALGMTLVVVIAIIAMPAPQPEVAFREGPEEAPLESLPRSSDNGFVSSARGYLAAIGGGSRAGGAQSTGRTRNGSMLIARDDLDSKAVLPPGTRLRVRLLERVVVSTQSIPVIGIVTQDLSLEGFVAIPRGSKVFGEVTFDSDSKRGSLSWRSILVEGGRVRPFDALSTGLDGQAGVQGRVHSDALKNTVGQTMTRFIGAYAEGSMERTSMFGGSPGGRDNGFKNAVAETAKDQADRMADKLKKEREWLELNPDSEFLALLTQPFRFRDPGGSY